MLLKALSGLLVLLMLVSLCSTVVFAASSYPNTHVNTVDQAADIVAVAVTQAGYCEGSLSGNPSYASSNNYQKFGQRHGRRRCDLHRGVGYLLLER